MTRKSRVSSVIQGRYMLTGNPFAWEKCRGGFVPSLSRKDSASPSTVKSEHSKGISRVTQSSLLCVDQGSGRHSTFWGALTLEIATKERK